MLPASPLALPSLAGIAPAYEFYDGDDRIFHLLRRMAEYGMVPTTTTSEEALKDLRTSPLRFATTVLKYWVAQQGGATIDREITYSLDIFSGYTDDLEHVKDGKIIRPLVITVESGAAGYLVVGPILKLLEKKSKALARAWYQVLVQSLRMWMTLYDLDTAEAYIEMQCEMRDEEDPAERENYEIPDLKTEIPDYLRHEEDSAMQTNRIADDDVARLRKYATDKKVGGYIRPVLEIHRLASNPIWNDVSEVAEGYYDQSPCPSCLVVLSPNDNIEGCFDMEAQYMLQASPAPDFAVAFNPADKEEAESAFRSLTNLLHINRELAMLIGEAKKLAKVEHSDDR